MRPERTSLPRGSVKDAGRLSGVHEPAIRPTEFVGQERRNQWQNPHDHPVQHNHPGKGGNKYDGKAQHGIPQETDPFRDPPNTRSETIL